MLQLRSYIQWLLVAVCEVPIVTNLLVRTQFPWSLALAAHGIATALAYFAPPRIYYKGLARRLSLTRAWLADDMRRPWALWLALWVLCLPGMGWLFGAVMVVGSRWGMVQTFEEDADAVLPADKLPREYLARDSTARVVSDLDFLPLVDVMAGDDMDLKRSAIEQLSRLRTPDAIHVLLQYCRDPQFEIRFYVNAALTHIKKEFDEEIQAARRQMQTDIYKISARIFLAKVYLQYVESGLLDSDMMKVYENEAEFHLNFAVTSDHPTPEAYRLLVEYYQLRGEWEKALTVVKKSQERDLGYDVEMQRQHVQIVYHLKWYAEVPAAIRKIQKQGDRSSDWQTAALWWGAS